MRAARYEGPGDLRVEEVPIPRPGPLEVLVRVESCGICLSDVHLVDGTLPPMVLPVTPGHEAAGRVAAVGSEVFGWSQGDRVLMAGGRACHACDRCRAGRLEECEEFQLMGFAFDGAWAEYVVVPFYGLTAVPEDLPVDEVAVLADAVATPFAALRERATLRAGESVGLWGIGGLGTHAVQLARLMGAAPVVAVDPLGTARDRALRVGADLALDPTDPSFDDRIREATAGRGLDVALDLVGSNAVLQQAVSTLGRGGRAVMVGLSLEPIHLEPSVIFGVRSHAVLGHLGYAKRDLDDLVRLLATGRLDLRASISEVLPLDEVEDGVRRLAAKEGDPVRIMVHP